MPDNINLPPMPPMRVLRTVMPDDHRYGHVHGFARRDLVQYARAAVLADREGRQQELAAARADADRLAAAIRAHQRREFNSDHPLLDRRLREHDALVDAQRAKEE